MNKKNIKKNNSETVMTENSENINLQEISQKQEKKHSDFQHKKQNVQQEYKKREFIDCIVEIKRVTKVTKGGKTFRFKAYVVSGDGNGKLGVGKGAGRDISIAIAKATTRARKYLFPVFKKDATIPYAVYGKHGASQVMLSPAYKGSGLIAGGSMRLVLKAIGVEDIVAKSIGTSRSGVNLVKATLNALAKCRSIEMIAQLRNKTKKQIILGSHYEA